MKTNSPTIVGASIFIINLGYQFFSSGTDQLDVYRAFFIALLAGVVFFIISPLPGRKIDSHKQAVIPVKSTYSDSETRKYQRP